MSLIDLLFLVAIAAVCGFVAQMLAGRSIGGCLASAVVGFIGAFLGMWLARQFGLGEPLAVHVGGQTFPVVWAIVGSVILVLIISLVRRV